MTIKEQLIREIEQAPEASLMQFIQIWQFAKQPSSYQVKLINTKISDFFRQSPLVEVAANGDLDLSRDRSPVADRFIV
jgi:hypothetical protein